MRRWAPWLPAALFCAARLALAPRTHNTHAIMYPVVAEVGGQNTLELFHPLYVPLLKLLHLLAGALGFSGPSLRLYQALSLAGAALHLRLIYELALHYSRSRKTALAAAVLGTASINLWAWSLQTMPYTLATSAALACFLLMARKEKTWKLGALAGLAAGFDTACLMLVPVALVEAGSSRRRTGLAVAFALALAACYVPFLLLGRGVPTSPSALLKGLPFDIVSVFQSRSLGAQLSQWLASTAPSDGPWPLFLALFAWGAARLTAGRAALLWFLGVSAFFLAADPHNRFVYAGAMPWPAVFAALAERRGFPVAACAVLFGALLAKNSIWPADYVPDKNVAFDEAAWARERLGGGALVSVSEPDLLFAYAYGKEILKPGENLKRRLPSELQAKKTVWLAGDALFRDSRVPKDELDRRVDAFVKDLKKDFIIGEPVVSPGGEYFYPLTPRPPRHPPRGG